MRAMRACASFIGKGGYCDDDQEDEDKDDDEKFHGGEDREGCWVSKGEIRVIGAC